MLPVATPVPETWLFGPTTDSQGFQQKVSIQPGDNTGMQGLNSTEIHVFNVSLWLVPGGNV